RRWHRCARILARFHRRFAGFRSWSFFQFYYQPTPIQASFARDQCRHACGQADVSSNGADLDDELVIFFEESNFYLLSERKVKPYLITILLAGERKRRRNALDSGWILVGPIERQSQFSKAVVAKHLIAEHRNPADGHGSKVLLDLIEG